MSAELAAEERTSSVDAAGSKLLETVARGRGLAVWRLTPEVLVCSIRQRRVAFVGLAGAGAGRVACVLCGDRSTLWRYLESRGLPTVDEAGDPAATVLAMVGGQLVATEPVRAGGPAEPPSAARELAQRAVAALPGAAYGSVTVGIAAGGPAIVSVDPLLGRWARASRPGAAEAVAAAVLDLEFADHQSWPTPVGATVAGLSHHWPAPAV